jgi:aryl-alcohol dehydrogenase-like predicted oxidoreductase
MFPVLRRENIGILAFSPMDRGALVPGREADLHAPLLDLIAVIDTVASELGVSRAEVCFAWTMTHPEVTSVLGGPERPEHVDQAVSGANMVLPGEAVTTLNAASIAFSTALESGQPYP